MIATTWSLLAAHWSDTSGVLAPSPNLLVRDGAGWLDERTFVLHGATRYDADSQLLRVTDTGAALVATPLYDEPLGVYSTGTSEPRFALAPDARSLLFIANPAPRRNPSAATFGSGDLPLQLDLTQGTIDPALDRAGLPLGEVREVLPLGARKLAFTAAVDAGWEHALYVHDMTRAQRVTRPAGDSLAIGSPLSAPAGRACAFFERDRPELVSVPDRLDATPLVARAPAGTLSPNGSFTGDGEWFVTTERNTRSFVAVSLRTGEPRIIGHWPQFGIGPLVTAPRGAGVAFAGQIGDSADEGLYFVDLATDRAPRLLGPTSPAFANDLRAWFSEDGQQLAYAPRRPEKAALDLTMWKLTADDPGVVRASFPLAAPGGSQSRAEYARALSGGRGLLFYPPTADLDTSSEAWVLPWLDHSGTPWRVPSSAVVSTVAQRADSDELVALEVAASTKRLLHFRIGTDQPLAALFELSSSYDYVGDVQVSASGTHVVYQLRASGAGARTRVARIDTPAQAFELPALRTIMGVPQFSPDSQYLAILASGIAANYALFLVPLERPNEYMQIPTQGAQLRRAWWIDP